MKKKLKITAFVLLLLLMGFFRESFFVNINSALYDKYYHENNHLIANLFSFLKNLSYQTIYVAKWFITPVFVLAYWFVQKRFLLVLFGEKKVVRWLSVLYLSLFLLAGIFFMVGWAFGNIEGGYTFSRLFMGLLQSPVPCMILIPVTYLYKKTNTNQS